MLETQVLRLDWFPIYKSHFTSLCDQSNTPAGSLLRTEFNLICYTIRIPSSAAAVPSAGYVDG